MLIETLLPLGKLDPGLREPDTPLDIRYMDALAEAIKRRTLLGGGVAWLPEFSIADELADGTLVRMGGASWTASLTISLFCSPDRLDEIAGRMTANTRHGGK